MEEYRCNQTAEQFREQNRKLGAWAEESYRMLKELVLEKGGRIGTDDDAMDTIYAMVCTGADLEEMRVTEILCGGVDADVMVSVTCPNWESGDSDTYSLKNDCWYVPTLANIVELVEEYV